MAESINFFKPETEAGIKEVLKRFMESVLKRRLQDEPWDYESYKLRLPFHVALVPEEIWKGAKFERSFVTSLGMIGWEEIARIIANDKRGYAKRGARIEGSIYKNKLEKINSILKDLEHGGRKPDWISELTEIKKIKGDQLESITIVADLYVEDAKTKEKFVFEIKSPLPNSDQTAVSKKKILQAFNLENPKLNGAYFALPFNPFGKKEDYNHAHPFRWFDMNNDQAVIMAKDFWDLLGGEGTYEALIKTFEEVGNEYKGKIRKEYLGLTDAEI